MYGQLKIYCEAGDNTAGNKNKCNSDQHKFFLNKHLLKHIFSPSFHPIILTYFFHNCPLQNRFFHQLLSVEVHTRLGMVLHIII